MARASDKARFYLERYVPELQEYERKNIFTREEITAIASKRSDFEHTLNARAPKPSDYARYVTYETNLDSLKRKRCRRRGVKTTSFSGQRVISSILDRATKRFPGDLGLWMQYINHCKREKASKKLAKVFTSVLRLKPREYGLWVLAAKYYAEEQGDMNAARSYLQRGLRFCKEERKLWLEYVRLEMVYLAKLAARRKILGLDEDRQIAEAPESNLDSDMMALPEVTGDEWNVDEAKIGMEEMDTAALERISSAPAFTGAIPMAIFDGAMKQFNNNTEVAQEIFDLVSSFKDVPPATIILQHIIDHVDSVAPHSVTTIACNAAMQLRGFDGQEATFPSALGTALTVLSTGTAVLSAQAQAELGNRALLLLEHFLESQDELDEDVLRVLIAGIKRYKKLASNAVK